jgi:hypothetical protein
MALSGCGSPAFHMPSVPSPQAPCLQFPKAVAVDRRHADISPQVSIIISYSEVPVSG